MKERTEYYKDGETKHEAVEKSLEEQEKEHRTSITISVIWGIVVLLAFVIIYGMFRLSYCGC